MSTMVIGRILSILASPLATPPFVQTHTHHGFSACNAILVLLILKLRAEKVVQSWL